MKSKTKVGWMIILLGLILSLDMYSQGNLMDTLRLNEVVVAATKTSHSIYSVPASISIVTKNTIENSPVIFADEALRGIAGIYVKRSKLADRTSTVNLRGFSGDYRTLVLLDGIPLNDGYNQSVNWGGIPTDAVVKVEVVKGSFSSLYGGNAMGGVINILTEVPKEETFTLKSSYGTYNTFITSASYSNSFLKSKKLSVFLNVTQKSSDGYASNFYQATAKAGTGTYPVTGWQKTTNNKGTEYFLLGHLGDNWMKQTQLVAKISYDFKPGTVLDFSISSAFDKYGYRNPQSFLKDASNLPFNNGSVTIDDGGILKTLSVRSHSFQNGPGNAYTNAYKLHYKTNIKNIQINSYLGFLNDMNEYISCTTGATEDGGPGSINTTKPKQTYIASLQADIPLRNHVLTLGADYKMYNAIGEEWYLSDWVNADSKTTMKSSMAGKQKIYAPFVQAEINILNGLKSYLGLRYDYWNNTDGRSSYGTSDTTYMNTSSSHLSPKAGLVYTPEMNWNIFKIKNIRVSAGESFRTPNLYNLYKTWSYVTTTYLSNPDLKPETSFSWEVGLTTALFNEKTIIIFDYYQSYIKDMMYNSEISTGVKKYMNAGKGEIKGFEAEIKQSISSFMDLNFNITKQKTKNTENSADPVSVGKSFTNVPNLLYNIGLNFYKGPVNLMLSYNFTDKIYTSSDNSDIVQGVYGGYDEQKLLDGKISYKFNKYINLSLAVNNILDREYYLYYKAPGRNYSVGLTAKF
ncbi:MAG: TonB-dependent receptor [Bacteroidales bacterium]|jgi:iron complex outermembrane receptor protein